MLYFLVWLVPFTAVMAYLIVHNRKLRIHYSQLTDRLIHLADEHRYGQEIPKNRFYVELVVSYQNIKTLERTLNSLELFFGAKHTKFVSNTFASRKKQLFFIEEKINKLEKHLSEEASKISNKS